VNIDWIIPCRFAEVHDGIATIVGAGIDTWWLVTLPAAVQVFVAVRLLATADELGPGIQHTMRTIVRDPDGEVATDVMTSFNAGTPAEVKHARGEWLNGMAIVTIVAFTAVREGSFALDCSVDGSNVTTPLHVVEGLPPGAVPRAGE
jgi:hypothetical protein